MRRAFRVVENELSRDNTYLKVSKSMAGISDITQQTATGIKEAAVTVNTLANLADELRASVAKFKLPEDHKNTKRTGPLSMSGFPQADPSGQFAPL